MDSSGDWRNEAGQGQTAKPGDDSGPAAHASRDLTYCGAGQPASRAGQYASGLLCTAGRGHEPLDHAAWGPDGTLYARWPVAEPAAATPASGIVPASLSAGTL